MDEIAYVPDFSHTPLIPNVASFSLCTIILPRYACFNTIYESRKMLVLYTIIYVLNLTLSDIK